MTRRELAKAFGIGALAAPLLSAVEKTNPQKSVPRLVPYGFASEHYEVTEILANVRMQYSEDGITWKTETAQVSRPSKYRYMRCFTEIPVKE